MTMRLEATQAVTSPANSAAASRQWALTAMALCVLAAWMLQHSYAGLMHDSSLYTLGALARLHPDSLSSDVFLRFGSQDRYTIFSPIYAAAIQLLDLQPAAALLTSLSQMGLFLGAWLVARCFMSANAALLGVGLLVVLPSDYGAFQVLHYCEDFLTPRLLAEAFALAGIAAALRGRHLASCLTLIAAVLLHPLMATAAVALLTLMYLAIPRPRLALLLGAAVLAGPLAIVWGGAPLQRLDAAWLDAVKSSSRFLFVTQWTLADWARLSLPVTTLAVGQLTAASPELRRLCGAALLMVGCCLAGTAIYCDWLHIVAATASQAWRWLWMSGVLAVVLTPVIVRDCWNTGNYGRIATILLTICWLLHEEGSIMSVALLGSALMAVAFAAIPGGLQESGPSRLLFYGSCAVLALLVILNIANKMQYVADPHVTVEVTAPLVRSLRGWSADGMIPAALLGGFCWLLARSESAWRNIACAAIAVLACIALVPSAWAGWTDGLFTPQLRDKFAQWREQIPPHAEVLWPDTPVGAWYLLERPSYWSNYQSAGAIFSRDKALLMGKRTGWIKQATMAKDPSPAGETPGSHGGVPGFVTGSLMTRRGLISACTDPDLGYVVSWTPLGPRPVFQPVQPNPNKAAAQLYIYRCRDISG